MQLMDIMNIWPANFPGFYHHVQSAAASGRVVVDDRRSCNADLWPDVGEIYVGIYLDGRNGCDPRRGADEGALPEQAATSRGTRVVRIKRIHTVVLGSHEDDVARAVARN